MPNATPNIDRLLRTDQHNAGLAYLTAEVTRTAVLTPRMLRVTLHAERLGTLASDHGNVAVRLFFPKDPSALEPLALTSQPPAALTRLRTRARVYTVRHWHPAADAIDIDVVRHSGGLAAGWAERALPGDRVLVAGPREHAVPPADAARVVLIGDATALPAISTILERMPPGARGVALIDVADAAERQRLVAPTGVDVCWLHAGDGDDLVTEVRDLVADPTWSAAATHVWLAGEHHTVRGLRAYLRDTGGLPRAALQSLTYWRAGATATQVDEGRAAAVVAALAHGEDPATLDEPDPAD